MKLTDIYFSKQHPQSNIIFRSQRIEKFGTSRTSSGHVIIIVAITFVVIVVREVFIKIVKKLKFCWVAIKMALKFYLISNFHFDKVRRMPENPVL